MSDATTPTPPDDALDLYIEARILVRRALDVVVRAFSVVVDALDLVARAVEVVMRAAVDALKPNAGQRRGEP